MFQLKSLQMAFCDLRAAMLLLQSTAIFCILAFPLFASTEENGQDFYEYVAVDIRGKVVPLKRYRGKVSLVVNVASECGYTDQHYKDLVKLQRELGPTDRFNVLAFPSNQFGEQEPGTDAQIEQFAKRKYNVNFPMFSKINVKDEDVPETWTFLTEKSGQVPSWNFFKYLVDGNGQVIKAWGPWVDVSAITHDVHDAVEEVTPPDLPYRAHHDDIHEEL